MKFRNITVGLSIMLTACGGGGSSSGSGSNHTHPKTYTECKNGIFGVTRETPSNTYVKIFTVGLQAGGCELLISSLNNDVPTQNIVIPIGKEISIIFGEYRLTFSYDGRRYSQQFFH